MKRTIIILTIALTAVSCGGRRGVKGAGDGADSLAATGITYPFTIDVSKEYPMEPVSFQEVFGELEYVALETTPECLIPDLPGLQSPVVTENDIFIRSGADIFRFGRDGKFLNRIGHWGRGPGEYLSATQMCVGEATGEVFVHDVLNKGILVYDYDGRHKRTLPTEYNAIMVDMAPLNDSTLLIANGQDSERQPVDAFQLISSHDGSLMKSLIPAHKEPNAYIAQTDIAIPPPASGIITYHTLPAERSPAQRYKGTGVGIKLWAKEPFAMLTEDHNIYSTDKGMMLTAFVMDTVYVASEAGELTPRWVKTPSPMSENVPKRRYSRFGFETDRYAFFYALGAGDKSGYKVDKSTGVITRTYLYDANIEHVNSPLNKIIFPTAINYGRLAMPYQPMDLIQGLEYNALSGELATLAATLKETDNPVLLIQKN